MKNAVARIGGLSASIGGAFALSAMLAAAPVMAQEDVKDIEIPVQKVDPAAKPAAPAAKAPAAAPAAKAPAAAPAAKPAAAAPAAKPAPAAAAPAEKAPAAAAAPAADKAAPAAAAPAAGAKAAAAAPGSDKGWVKICDKIPVAKKDKDGKDAKEEKTFCVTQTETIDGNSGLTIASIGIQNFEGEDKQVISALVPLGMVIPQGLTVAMLTKEQVDAAKEQKLDFKTVKQVELKFSHCIEVGCFAEAQATPEIIADIKSATSLAVAGLHIMRRGFMQPLPVANFAEALAGPPVDNKQYTDARKQLMAQIAERRKEMAKQQQEQAEAMKNLPGKNTTGAPAETGSTAAAPAAKAPEKKQ